MYKFLKCRTARLVTVVFICLMTFQTVSAKQLELKTSQEGKGLNHKIIVESPGNFRLAFENGLNYGLSQWFDLKHDPDALFDLTDNATNYIPVHEQGALFNQCLNPDDLIAHVAGAKNHFKEVPRSIKVLERSPIKVVLENSHHPMLGKKNEGLLFKTRYTIYPDGKIFIKNTLIAIEAQDITMWRNSIVGLSDPTYKVNTDSGKMIIEADKTMTDKSKKWKTDQWSGYQLNLPDWRSYEIISNTENTLALGKQISGANKPLLAGDYKIDSRRTKFGWLRGDSVAFPKTWHEKTSKFIYAYWDPSTPEPYKSWSSASIMLVPSPANEKQGFGAGIHGWKGFKRMYYEYGSFSMKKDESISQEYLLVLGSNTSKVLPDLRSREVALKIAEEYRATCTNKSSYPSAGI
ncbi:hypothetical protein PQO03_08585 [Lentisphaera profundi]|uniref:Uncharacterized protein n=1 Tax=Lentisphaera profundi TaxID=1658616 RepID=A0ABY7VRB1_9BACT|nr:hypothetical protein [Lentisphaera profundi]WDE95770.1 hypothetical protein PQO03_08585 [Lentisphaera profundi]